MDLTAGHRSARAGARRALDVSPRAVLRTVLLCELVVWYCVMRNSSWAFDDNFLLVRAREAGLSWSWLTAAQYEHWDLGMNAALSAEVHLFFFDYRWVLVLMILCLAAIVLVFERVLALLVENRWVAVGFALWLGMSVVWARMFQWWSAGLQFLPNALFDLVCLYAYLRWLAGGSRRWAGLSVLALAAGLVFYEKTAYMLLYLPLIRVLLLGASLRPREIVAAFWRERYVWIGYGAVVALWGVGYMTYASPAATAGHVRLDQYLAFFRIFWLQTLVPSFASLTVPGAGLSGLQVALVVVLQVAVIATVAASLRRKRSAWRAWALLAIVIVANGVLVAYSRIAQFTVMIATERRYLVDFIWLVPLVLCVAFARRETLWPRLPAGGGPSVRLSMRPRLPALAAVVGLVAYGVVAVASATDVQRNWPGPFNRTWTKHVRGGIERMQRNASDLVVADNVVPESIIGSFAAPYNRLSRVLALYAPVQVDGALRGPLATVLPDGTVRPAHAEPIVAGGDVAGLVRGGHLTVGAVKPALGGREVCVAAAGGAVPVERTWAGPAPPDEAGPYYVRLTYRVQSRFQVPVYVDTGSGYPGQPDHVVWVAPDATASIGWLGPSPPHKILLNVLPSTRICVSRIDIVTVRAST